MPWELNNKGIPSVKLEVIRALDERLPTLSDRDMNQILNEAKRIVRMKLGSHIDFHFHDNGIISLDELFKDKSYRNTARYRKLNRDRYDLERGPDMPYLKEEKFKKRVIKFLKRWDLKDLTGFFPDQTIINYDDVYNNLFRVYHQRVSHLKTLRTPNGNLLLKSPLPPYQSYVEWGSFLRYQDRYDIIFTNTLIMADLMSEPYPHSVLKHAKIGGGGFLCPKCTAFNGNTVMISTIEEHGNIKGLSDMDKNISRELKNKVIGGFLLAHEIGHALYLLPDVYDHGDMCLMSSSLSNFDYVKGYNLLLSDPTACSKCLQDVRTAESIIYGKLAYKDGAYNKAADFYLEGAGKMPSKIGDYVNWYKWCIYQRALELYEKIGHQENIEKTRRLIESLEDLTKKKSKKRTTLLLKKHKMSGLETTPQYLFDPTHASSSKQIYHGLAFLFLAPNIV